MSELANNLIEIVGEQLKRKLPEAVKRGLAKLADDAAMNDRPAEAAVLSILADYAVDMTPEAVDALSGHLIDLIDGKKDATIALYNLGELDAHDLSRMTDALQTAEADDKARAREWARNAGSLIGDVGRTLLIPVVEGLLKGDA